MSPRSIRAIKSSVQYLYHHRRNVSPTAPGTEWVWRGQRRDKTADTEDKKRRITCLERTRSLWNPARLLPPPTIRARHVVNQSLCVGVWGASAGVVDDVNSAVALLQEQSSGAQAVAVFAKGYNELARSFGRSVAGRDGGEKRRQSDPLGRSEGRGRVKVADPKKRRRCDEVRCGALQCGEYFPLGKKRRRIRIAVCVAVQSDSRGLAQKSPARRDR